MADASNMKRKLNRTKIAKRFLKKKCGMKISWFRKNPSKRLETEMNEAMIFFCEKLSESIPAEAATYPTARKKRNIMVRRITGETEFFPQSQSGTFLLIGA